MLSNYHVFSSTSGSGLTGFTKERTWRLPNLILETALYNVHARAVLNKLISAAASKALRE